MTSQLMNHDEALKTLATERYLLQEMNDEQRRDFEEHYLGCPECFEAVIFGSDFVTEMRNVPLPAPAPGFREKLARFFASLMRPAPALAFAALLALVGLSAYQATVINHQQKLLAIAQAPKQEFRFVIRGQSRSRTSANVITLKRSDNLSLRLEFDPVSDLISSKAELK